MLVLAVVLLALNMRTVIASLPPLLADVRDDLGLSATVAGLLTTLPVVCFGAFAFLTPRLARRYPVERVLAACAGWGPRRRCSPGRWGRASGSRSGRPPCPC